MPGTQDSVEYPNKSGLSYCGTLGDMPEISGHRKLEIFEVL